MFKVGDKVRVVVHARAFGRQLYRQKAEVVKVSPNINDAYSMCVVFTFASGQRWLWFKESELELLSSEGGE